MTAEKWNEVRAVLDAAFKRGNTVELKLERGQLVIVEITRKVKIKTAAIG